MTTVFAADIGGASIRAARVEMSGRILARLRAPTPPDPARAWALLRELHARLGSCGRSGVVVPGGIDDDTGVITESPNLRAWEGHAVSEALDCRVLNDANGALLGESWLGSLHGFDTALMLTLGTGVGGAVKIAGRLWTGARGTAGEIGHVPVEPDGPRCGSGHPGCLEVYASGTAIAEAAGTDDARAAAERARAGDARAVAAFERAGRALGIALAGLANVLNPQRIAIGGGVAPAFDLLEPALLRELEARAFRLAFESLSVVPAQLGEDAGLLGAARWALDAPTGG